MKRWLIFCVFFFGIIFVGICSASYDLNSSGVEQNYVVGDFVKGILNMSYSGGDLKFEGSSGFSEGENILDVLEAMNYVSGLNYSCNPKTCLAGYTSVGIGESLVTINPLEKDKVFYSFRVFGKSAVVNSIKFNITSSAGKECKNQLSVDIFNDGDFDFLNTINGSDVCGKEIYGGFDESGEVRSAIISGTVPYCEKITIDAAPAYKIGAKVQLDGGFGKLAIALYKEGSSMAIGGTSGKQPIPLSDGSGDYEIKYNVAGSLTPFTGYVCVSKPSYGGGDFTVKSKATSEPQGGRGHPPNVPLEKDYEIYVQKIEYAKLGELEFNYNSESNVVENANQYLIDNYGRSCLDENGGCAIPLSLRGEVDVSQNVKIHDIRVEYETATSGGEIARSEKLYELEKQDVEVEFENLMLDVEEMEIEVPDEEGTYDFVLSLDGEDLVEEEIYVEELPDFTIGPRFALIGVETTFAIYSSMNVTSSTWKFENASAETSFNNQITHLFTKSGEYELDVTVSIKNKTLPTRTFKITVGDIRASVNYSIRNYGERISKIKTEVNTLGKWIQDKLKSSVDIEQIETAFNGIKDGYNVLTNSSPESKYEKIITDILVLGEKIPDGVSVVKATGTPVELGYDNINIGLLAELSGSSSYDNDETKNNVMAWMEKYYKVLIDYSAVQIETDSIKRTVLVAYNVHITPKESSLKTDYLFIGQPKASLTFKEYYNERDLSGSGISMSLGSGAKDIEFLISGAVAIAPEKLGIFISPVMSELGGTGKPFCNPVTMDCEPPGFPWGFYLGWTIGLLVVILICYIILQEWYKRNYEKHLFKNKDALYNMINFIYNSRMNGNKDERTEKGLVSSGWKKEQVKYAFNKIDGKRTGMWEIPIFKFFENLKVKKSIETKNSGRRVDTRFIKR